MRRHHSIAKAFIAICCVLTLSACGGSKLKTPDSGVAVKTGFVRTPSEGAPSTAGYLSLVSAEDDFLIAAEVSGADSVELHTMTMDGDVMQMFQLDKLALPAGEIITLAPGGTHMMIMKPDTTIVTADSVVITLRFANAPSMTVEMPVQREEGGHNHH